MVRLDLLRACAAAADSMLTLLSLVDLLGKCSVLSGSAFVSVACHLLLYGIFQCVCVCVCVCVCNLGHGCFKATTRVSWLGWI